MPNKKAAIKRLRQDKKKHSKNKSAIAEVRTLAKKAKVSIDAKDKKEAETALRNLESKIDKASRRNMISRNSASRKISRLRQQYSKIEK